MILKMKNSITQFKTSKGGQNNQGFKTRQRKSEHLAKFNDKLKESIRIGHKKNLLDTVKRPNVQIMVREKKGRIPQPKAQILFLIQL